MVDDSSSPKELLLLPWNVYKKIPIKDNSSLKYLNLVGKLSFVKYVRESSTYQESSHWTRMCCEDHFALDSEIPKSCRLASDAFSLRGRKHSDSPTCHTGTSYCGWRTNNNKTGESFKMVQNKKHNNQFVEDTTSMWVHFFRTLFASTRCYK